MISDFGFPISDLNLARYSIRASFPQERMTYIKEESKGSYQSKDGEVEKVFDAFEWLAAMCLTRVNPAVAGVRNYGYYSNASRGKRNKNAQGERIHSKLEPEELSKEHRKSWTSLIQNIYEVVDPLICPKCQCKNSPVFSVGVRISCGTSFALKDSVFCYKS